MNVAATLRELAGGGHHGLVLGDHFEDLELAAAELEEELAREGLVILLAQRLVPLREVVALLHLEASSSLDELHRVLAAAEAGLLHADLEGIDALVVRLHVAVRKRAGRVDLLQAGRRVLEEVLVGRGVEHAFEDGDIPVDADEAVTLAAEGGHVHGDRDRPVAGDLVLLAEAEIEALRHEGDALRAEEDSEDAVEAAADLREERGHVRGAERHAGRAHDLATVLLDLRREARPSSTGPTRSRRTRCATSCPSCSPCTARPPRPARGEVERAERVAAALRLRDRGVEAHGDHVDELVLLVHRHAGEAHVREVAAGVGVDLVLDDELLRLAPAHVGLRLVVGDEQLDRPAVDARRPC